MVVMNASLQIAIYAIALNVQIRTMKICIMQRRMKKDAILIKQIDVYRRMLDGRYIK